MEIVATLYTLALPSGVIVLLPTLAKKFFALRVGKNLKRMWLDARNVVGILSLPFPLVTVQSAVVFAYHDRSMPCRSDCYAAASGARVSAARPTRPRLGQGPGCIVPSRAWLLRRLRSLHGQIAEHGVPVGTIGHTEPVHQHFLRPAYGLVRRNHRTLAVLPAEHGRSIAVL